jgi:hypothetical protein
MRSSRRLLICSWRAPRRMCRGGMCPSRPIFPYSSMLLACTLRARLLDPSRASMLGYTADARSVPVGPEGYATAEGAGGSKAFAPEPDRPGTLSLRKRTQNLLWNQRGNFGRKAPGVDRRRAPSALFDDRMSGITTAGLGLEGAIWDVQGKPRSLRSRGTNPRCALESTQVPKNEPTDSGNLAHLPGQRPSATIVRHFGSHLPCIEFLMRPTAGTNP